MTFVLTTINDWKRDIENKIKYLENKQKEKHLKSLEDKLNVLLSNEKRTELEIDEIKNSLKI